MLMIGLILAAMILGLFELLIPSFGLITAAAIACVCGAIYIAFTISPTFGLAMVAFCVIAAPLYIVAVIRFLPRTSVGRRLFLKAVPPATGSGTPDVDQFKQLVGKTGTADTSLRPSGIVVIDGQRIQASAEAGLVARGATVKVVAAQGFNVIVRKIESSS